jgi:exodeoxyribonuclease V alpha subunit
VVDIVARGSPAKFGLDPVCDIQVLTPMHRGPAGAGNLNAVLQEAQCATRPDARETLRRAGVPRRGQGHPAAQQLPQR